MEKKKKKLRQVTQEPVANPSLLVHVCSAGNVLSHYQEDSLEELENELADNEQKSL